MLPFKTGSFVLQIPSNSAPCTDGFELDALFNLEDRYKVLRILPTLSSPIPITEAAFGAGNTVH
jgi:hypothetical protein